MKAIRVLYAFLAIVLAASMLPAAPVQAQAAAQPPAAEAEFIPGQVMVTFKAGGTSAGYAAQAAALAGLVQGEVVKIKNSRALLAVSEDADIRSVAAWVAVIPGIEYAEPNYIYKLTPVTTTTASVPQTVTQTVKVGSQTAQVPVDSLIKLRTTRAGKTSATYPNDRGYTDYDVLGWIGYDIIWNNTTVAKNVCLIDTGVDSTHPDLYGKVINGLDLVNGDSSPMDDNGHGTFVAGLIAALPNNGIGTAGVSNGKVVAVKAADATGRATLYDLADAVRYCADRTDVAVINMSLESPASSNQLKAAVEYAVYPHKPGTTSIPGKLIVAAAGNSGSYALSYPAAYKFDFDKRVLAVGAAGYQAEPWDWVDPRCQANYSNYGDFIDLVAPGTQLYSTTPYNKPFYLNTVSSVSGNYDTMSGTSMAAALVSGAAARAWAYKSTYDNLNIAYHLQETGRRLGDQYYWEWGCWSTSMENAAYLNIASSMNRGGLAFNAVNAQTGAALDGATVYLFKGTSLVASSKLAPVTYTDGSDSIKYYSAFAEFTNLEPGVLYTAKISKTGYTTTLTAASTNAVNAFVGWDMANGQVYAYSGYTSLGASAAVPPLSSQYTVVTAGNYSDPEQLVYLPSAKSFIVSTGPHGWDGYVPGVSTGDPYAGDATGSLRAWPYARQVFTVDGNDWYTKTNTAVIKNRSSASLPYYTGTYTLGAFDSNYGNTSMFIWKSGKATRIDRSCAEPNVNPYWKAATINSGSTAATVTVVNTCGSKEQMAYQGPNMLRVAIGGGYPDTLDPQRASFVAEVGHLQLMYEGLTRLNENLEVVPGASAYWIFSNAGKTLSITLRPNLTYQDGSILNAERFRYAMLRTMDPYMFASYGSIYNDIVGASEYNQADLSTSPDLEALREAVQLYARHADGITACSGYEDAACTRLIMNFNNPAYYFPQLLSLWTTYPAKQEIIDTYGYTWWDDPAHHIGNGPFVLDRYVHGSEAIFIPASGYWGAHPSYSIKYQVMNSEDAIQAYWQGDIDIFTPTPDQGGYFGSDLMLKSGTCFTGLGFNLSAAPFDNPKVRQAFAYAIDRDAWISDVLGGGGLKTLSLIPPGIAGYDASETRWDYDPAAAVQALTDAGMYDPDTFTYTGPEIKFTYAENSRNTTRWSWLKDHIDAILGTNITLEPLSSADYSTRASSDDNQPQTYISGWCGDYPDPQNYLTPTFATDGVFSRRLHYNSSAFDAKVAEANAADAATRIPLYQQAEDLLLDDLPYAPMWNNIAAYVVHPRVTGVSFTAFDNVWPGILTPASITVNP